MKAAVYDRYGSASEGLRVVEVERPEPGPGEVRVKVHVSAVNPTDYKSRGGARPRPIDGFQIPHHDLWPPAGVDLPAAAVEVAVRPVLFESNGASNLTLRGLVFEHANSCIGTKPGAAVMISGGSHVIVEDAAFRWNNWIGLDLF